jgi:hypothetical protein
MIWGIQKLICAPPLTTKTPITCIACQGYHMFGWQETIDKKRPKMHLLHYLTQYLMLIVNLE